MPEQISRNKGYPSLEISQEFKNSMKPSELIHEAAKQGRVSLTEAESKTLLKHYGVPVVEEFAVSSEIDAVERSRLMGLPVVLKGLGKNLIHKTERGLVKLNLRSEEGVRHAFRHIREAAGVDWEGCLIQPMVVGKREFVAGLFRDAQFGPVVMFGLGGIFTEAIGDVVFGIAPMTRVQARDMMDRISSRKLLYDFRGESAADEEQLSRTLIGLSELGEEHPEIMEVDVNPLIITPEGRVKAVDALVVLKQRGETAGDDLSLNEREVRKRVDVIHAALDIMTHPKSIAVVGAKRPRDEFFPGMFECISDFGFPGKLYPINPHVDEIKGYKAYPNLFSLPGPVDLVIICLPAQFVPEVLKDCAGSGNRNIHIFTAGFKETGEEEGRRLQEEIQSIAREGGLHIIGPNCMGLYVPASRIVTWPGAAGKSGHFAFISQSGGYAQELTHHASSHYGLYASKVISYGNGVILDCTDFLEYLARDPETRIIGMYLEGVKDGGKLLRQVTAINRTKPVIILKGGLTESGARTVASHTGSLAGGAETWNAFFRQSGAVRVDSLEEMAEVALALLHLRESSGRRVAVIGLGGGLGVSVADECAKAGLDLPALPLEVQEKLRKFVPVAGTMIGNPIDALPIFLDLQLLGKTLELLADGHIDMFILSLALDWFYNFRDEQGAHIEKVASYIAKEARTHAKGKPLVVAWRQYQNNPDIRKWSGMIGEMLLQSGVPFYQGLPKAVNALSKVTQYYEFKGKKR